MNKENNSLNPNFIGIGASRSGTTWLLTVLEEHPEVSFPYAKELNYLSSPRSDDQPSEYEKRGIKGYLKLFESCDKNKIKGELSNHYLPDKKVATIIKKHFPNVKIFVSIRNPVERAFSDYLSSKKFHLQEKDSFEEAFYKEKNILYKKGRGYKERGLYYQQLKPYFDLFPKENIHVVLFDDIENNPEKVVKDFYNFLGIKDSFIPPSLHKVINKSPETKFKLLKKAISFLAALSHKLEKGSLGPFLFYIKRKTKADKFFNNINKANTKPAEKEKLDSYLYKKINQFYIKDIKNLEKLIKRDLSPWRS